jgi:hypothetical protein
VEVVVCLRPLIDPGSSTPKQHQIARCHDRKDRNNDSEGRKPHGAAIVTHRVQYYEPESRRSQQDTESWVKTQDAPSCRSDDVAHQCVFGRIRVIV